VEVRQLGAAEKNTPETVGVSGVFRIGLVVNVSRF
jgi:hypothetical protein